MKVIIDVQKLYDELGKRTNEEIGVYMKLKIGALMISNVLPDWASKPTATNKAKLSGGYTEGFESFWNNYPKKTGKGTAFLEWQKVNKKEEILEMVLNALVWQKTAWAKDNNKYVPMPENYLKGRRWEDEPPKQTQEPKGVYF